ncbi:RNA polymerase-binding protein DksA [Hydrogenophaga palleronii]|uniref:RNA polymerase-binding protein DksA n=1 Tax=Hydrogenophaga palleronii TaxID=65655 RepID=UPI0009FC6183|nr:RNA polymerase-binding protein DksA [Hydrogenophaga palleronii]
MKAPATKTAKSGKAAVTEAKARVSVATPKASAKAKPAPKAVAKPAAKTAAKTTRPVSKVAATKPAATKPVAKTAAKPVAKAAPAAKKSSVPAKSAKPVAKAPVKPAAKAAATKKLSPARPAPRAPAVAAKTPAPAKAAKPVVKATAKPVAKTATKATTQPAAKAAVSAVSPSVPKAAPAAAVSKSSSAKRPATPVVVEPTPRPLGKRAAKKVMMEQMTQAAVVPTHAPDAAKATFSNMNQRAVMTPPVPSSIQKDPKRANNWKTLPVEQLTDQDVQAMPDSEYMSDLQLAYFRRKLSQLKADMLANAGETTEHLREDTVVVPDPADRATIEEEHALELRTRDRERKLLKKIEQAIARIDSGDYGYCEETGEPIGVGRLMARPTASLSLEAQQRRELKQKMFGD